MPSAPSRLRCEFLKDPLGIDERNPRLSWWVDDPRPAELQTAYHLLASSSKKELDRDVGDLWDSGRLDSREFHNVEYRGTLKSGQRVWWKVRTYDSDGLGSPWSSAAFFEMGVLVRDEWRARWISAPLMGDRHTPPQVPALRRTFDLPKKVARARLYATALGVYDIEINGQRAIDVEFAPGWTDYKQRVRYQTFDVTNLLCEGENVIGALLGDGWYCGFLGASNRQNYGDKPELFAQINVQFEDWTHTVIETDHRWLWQRSHIVASDISRGESVDGRQRLGDWSSPGYDDTRWFPVEVDDRTEVALTGAIAPPVRVLQAIGVASGPRKRCDADGRRHWIYDFGQNFVGRVRLKIIAKRGTLVRLRYAERLSPDGTFGDSRLLRFQDTQPYGADYYTAAGDPDGEIFEPKFSFHGFQFVEIAGEFPDDVLIEIEGVVLGSDLDSTGYFHCDHPLVMQLQHNIRWSQRGSFFDIPMDSPQRMQRLGKTGAALAFIRTAAYNMDVAAFYAKWLLDVADAILEDGRVPPAAPLPPDQRLLNVDGGPAWSDALVICPWTIYRSFGDRRLLERHYPAMRRFVTGLEKRFEDLIRTDDGEEPWLAFGDWQVFDGVAPVPNTFGSTPRDLIGTAFFYYSSRLLARSAGVLHMLSDLERFEQLAHRIRSAFRRRFVTAGGRLVGETQTSYVLAIHFGLLEGLEKEHALRLLVADIEARGDRLSTGFVGAPYLLQVLTDAGRLDVAYRLLLQTEVPGWLHPVTQGATTVWERGFEPTPGRASHNDAGDDTNNFDYSNFNSYAHGAIGEWLFGTCAGIGLDPDLAPEKNAYRHAIIRPRPPIGPGFPDIPMVRRVETALDTVHGRYEVFWEIGDADFRLKVTVPPGCSATLTMPDGDTYNVVSGTHTYHEPLDRGVDGIPILREVS